MSKSSRPRRRSRRHRNFTGQRRTAPVRLRAKKRIAFLEQKMEENEQTIAQLTEQMGDPQIASDYQKVEEICQQIEQLKNESEAFGEEWLELSAEE